MEYKFYKKEIETTGSVYFLIESKSSVLTRFGDSGWTINMIQEIINNVENNKTKPKGQEYIWANENLTLYSNVNGILLIDVLSQKSGIDDTEKTNLLLNHEEFIDFMENFKKFVAENS
ncbi:hypothetical protein GOQ30_17605 [Flavobacterium sp. TP390]|uniref:Uncharacterized protein n=1 Tax=Flavobacterium profundi TaxID=1774945 RepID=A0A6I4IVL8_9FLAO|nr:hypothetical protein [Flavobacterium profundi]MVO10992.1 hypothetical protein [Flavobacterium profundi]